MAIKSHDTDGSGKGVIHELDVAGQVYYIRREVREDQEGAEYQFLAVATTNSFGQTDAQGNIIPDKWCSHVPAAAVWLPIPAPGSLRATRQRFHLGADDLQAQARKVVVNDTITHQNFGDPGGRDS